MGIELVVATFEGNEEKAADVMERLNKLEDRVHRTSITADHI
jgi:hypothetical protein